jgi:hypothetical protein
VQPLAADLRSLACFYTIQCYLGIACIVFVGVLLVSMYSVFWSLYPPGLGPPAECAAQCVHEHTRSAASVGGSGCALSGSARAGLARRRWAGRGTSLATEFRKGLYFFCVWGWHGVPRMPVMRRLSAWPNAQGAARFSLVSVSTCTHRRYEKTVQICLYRQLDFASTPDTRTVLVNFLDYFFPGYAVPSALGRRATQRPQE